jgi:hypothetical protein
MLENREDLETRKPEGSQDFEPPSRIVSYHPSF